ncbi:MAG: hypothetical protein HY868_20720 [Chloroflexi bacterium]|nr:hypothetical protein [Chloroflexota bacterium]
MNRLFIILMFASIALPFALTPTANAMPEYATRTGEPCGTCHTSAAGGGLRSPRGQGWVAQTKPSAVPTLDESLKILGVNITTNPADYLAPSILPAAPAPLVTRFDKKLQLLERLLEYDGN